MTKTTYTLSCKLRDSRGKTHCINIDNPAEDLDVAVISDFMQFLIDTNVITPVASEPSITFIEIVEAALIEKTVNILFN